ncbi:hypothetical protein R2R70_18665 [Cobetia sp. SIMBA_158]|uniref:hypothetical protein n=1 Tax=Cobetia sp. SIMBA_158 TaxID=3081617 RepID=UPI00397EAB2F
MFKWIVTPVIAASLLSATVASAADTEWHTVNEIPGHKVEKEDLVISSLSQNGEKQIFVQFDEAIGQPLMSVLYMNAPATTCDGASVSPRKSDTINGEVYPSSTKCMNGFQWDSFMGSKADHEFTETLLGDEDVVVVIKGKEYRWSSENFSQLAKDDVKNYEENSDYFHPEAE